MSLRSFLFVPGDSDRKLAKSAGASADALILDLEDSVTPAQKPAARSRVREFLLAHPRRPTTQLWVRINPLDTSDALADLAALIGAQARWHHAAQDALRLTISSRLAHYLDAFESAAQSGGRERSVSCPWPPRPPKRCLRWVISARCGPRLLGLTWGAEDLSTAIGATSNQDG